MDTSKATEFPDKGNRFNGKYSQSSLFALLVDVVVCMQTFSRIDLKV